MDTPRLFSCACLGLALCVCGCGAGTYPVLGLVQFEDGQAATELAGGFVSFQGIERDVSAQGEIRQDGTFELSTFAEGDGALPGKYRVLITPPPFTGGEAQRAPQLIDPAFSDPSKARQEITVEAQRNEVTVPVRRFRSKTDVR